VLPVADLEQAANTARSAAAAENMRTRAGFFNSLASPALSVPDPLGLQQLPVIPQPTVIYIAIIRL
jgi:hypothetical protein